MSCIHMLRSDAPTRSTARTPSSPWRLPTLTSAQQIGLCTGKLGMLRRWTWDRRWLMNVFRRTVVSLCKQGILKAGSLQESLTSSTARNHSVHAWSISYPAAPGRAEDYCCLPHRIRHGLLALSLSGPGPKRSCTPHRSPAADSEELDPEVLSASPPWSYRSSSPSYCRRWTSGRILA